MGKFLHAEEVEVSDQALAVTINDALSEHGSMVARPKHSTQATMAEHSFGSAVRYVHARSQPPAHPQGRHRERFGERNGTPSRLPPVDRQPAHPHAREGGRLR